MSKYKIHTADSRGAANHGWLQAHHSFSFANWYNPERIQFGMLRVLNDDTIAAGMGFGSHPHDNMEIITIPLYGDLAHKDSMGHAETIKQGDVQVMSAGTGIYHSEFNPNPDKRTELLQIWVFPKYENVTPRYQQITLDEEEQKNKWQQIVSPNPDDQGAWIHQDAWFSLAQMSEGFEQNYVLKNPNNGIYIFVIEGNIEVLDNKLNKRDAIGIWETESVEIKSNADSKVLVIEVPMQ